MLYIITNIILFIILFIIYYFGIAIEKISIVYYLMHLYSIIAWGITWNCYFNCISLHSTKNEKWNKARGKSLRVIYFVDYTCFFMHIVNIATREKQNIFLHIITLEQYTRFSLPTKQAKGYNIYFSTNV